MNPLIKNLGIGLYSLGFSCTFCQSFNDVVNDEYFLKKKNKTSMDYTLYAVTGTLAGLYNGVFCPVSLTAKAVHKYNEFKAVSSSN